MKSLNRWLLLAGLCLVPTLVCAAPDIVAPCDAAPQPDLLTGVSSDECSVPAGLDATLEASPACGVETDLFPDDLAAPSSEKKPGGCKACPQQPWCGCTYQGHPRVSCDPCCYQTYTGEICLS